MIERNFVSFFIFFEFFFTLLIPNISHAVSSAPIVHELEQPDGVKFFAYQRGDENIHWWETTEGYTIVFNRDINAWTYATLDEYGYLEGTLYIVGKDPAPFFSRGLRPQPRIQKLQQLVPYRRFSKELKKPTVSPKGQANVAVILVNFGDTAYSFEVSDFEDLLFGTGKYSMSDYYKEVSYGAFVVTSGPEGVSGWYDASQNHDYYGSNDFRGNDRWPGDLVYEAVRAADAAGFNFAPYDQDGDCYVDVVMVVHQGTGEEASGVSTDIWSHRWSLNSARYYGYSHYGEYVTDDTCTSDPSKKVRVNDYTLQPEKLTATEMITIGVFAHEYGHTLGLPDLYDTDYSSEGIGKWSIMAAGSWNSVNVLGDRPSHFDAWSKFFLGWVVPTKVKGALINESIRQVETSPDVYQLLSGKALSGEYFLLENRQRVGFDRGLPGEGLLIWHIDGDKINTTMGSNTVNNAECYPGGLSCSNDHYGVKLIQADNLWDLERKKNRGDSGDSYPGLKNNTSFDKTSSPDSSLYNGSDSKVSVVNISPSGSIMTATLIDATEQVFEDVPPTHWAYNYINTIYNKGITSGCSSNPLLYCPDSSVTRAQMAVFILKAMGEGPAATCTGNVFSDVNAQTVGEGFCRYIEKFATLGITAGCQADDPGTPQNEAKYCPDDEITRAQMAVFITKALKQQPAASCTGTVFDDVNAGSVGEGFCRYIEKFSKLGITSGCSSSPPLYCPNNSVTRAQMAVFLVKGFSLTQKGRVFYVSPQGDNSNPGTLEQPWATPGYGSRQLQPGDTLVILGGRYILSQYPDDIISPPSGTQQQWTTIRGEEGNRPVFVGRDNLSTAIDLSGRSYVRIENLEITSDDSVSGSSRFFREGIQILGSPASHIVLEDMYIHHIDEFGIDVQDVENLQLLNCHIEYCGFGAIGGPTGQHGGWRNVVIRGCSLSYSGHYYQDTDGSNRPYDRPDGFGIEPSRGPIFIEDTIVEHNYGDGIDSKATNTTVRRCVVANNSCDGVKLWGDQSRIENTLIYGRGDGDPTVTPWSPIVISTEADGARFEIVNVTVDDALGGNYLMYVQYDYPDVPVTLITRNTIFSGRGNSSPIFIGRASTLIAEHNLFYMPKSDFVLTHGDSTYTSSSITQLGRGNIYGDPLFVFPAWGSEGDYHLQSGSPAIDAGTSISVPSKDLDGNRRPQGGGIDIGAYER